MTIDKTPLFKPLKNRQIRSHATYLLIIFKFSTFFFTFAYFTSIIGYILSEKAALLWGNVLSVMFIWVVFILFRAKKLKLNTSLLLHIAIISVNLYYGMLHEAVMGEDGSILHVVECMCVCTIPAVLAGMTNRKWLPTIIAIGAVICYVIAGIGMGNPEGMITHVPAFAIVIVGLGFTYSYLLKLNRAVVEENKRVKTKQRNIARMLDMTPKQWELIKQGRMSQQRMKKLLSVMKETTREKMLTQMKTSMLDEEEIKEAIRSEHPHLTAGDMALIVLIVRRKSVTQIAKLQNIKIHSVTARRSRLRTKLGLDKEQSLNDYLVSVARREA